MRSSVLVLCTAVFVATLHAQTFAAQSSPVFATHPCTDTIGEEDHSFFAHFFSGEQVCEVRSATFPLVTGHLNVNGQNGSIEVVGQDRQDVALEARVSVRAGSQAEAAAILHEITVDTGGTVEAHGPHSSGNGNWSVSYKLLVPRHVAGNFRTTNGSLSLTALEGSVRGETSNGSLHLDKLDGDVQVRTTNGSIRATLDGSTWRGSGLVANTTNGGVSVSLPLHYSAHLIANTTNGGTSLSVPGASQSGVHRNSIDTNLGSGGPTISFTTTNGGIAIQ